jgi:hypothetical protein
MLAYSALCQLKSVEMLRPAQMSAMRVAGAAFRDRAQGPVWAYSVEKLRHAKIASETWNAVPTIG